MTSQEILDCISFLYVEFRLSLRLTFGYVFSFLVKQSRLLCSEIAADENVTPVLKKWLFPRAPSDR